MKIKSLCAALESFAQTLSASEANARAEVLRELLASLEQYSSSSVTDLMKFTPTNNSESLSGGRRLRDVVSVLRPVVSFVGVIGKKAYVDDLNALLEFLTQRQDWTLSSLRKTEASNARSAGRARAAKAPVSINAALVANYLAMFEKALGNDPAFMAAYERLKNDKGMTQKDMAVLADQFMGPVAPSTSRKKAMERVLYRHRKLVEFTDGS